MSERHEEKDIIELEQWEGQRLGAASPAAGSSL